MTERTAEEVAAGFLRVAVGATTKEVPTLKARYVAEWGELLAAADASGKPLEEWTFADVGRLSGQSVDRMLDLVVAYDRTAALGGREWLAENADPSQLHTALVAMVGNAFPLADDPAVLVGLLLARAAVGSTQPSSTNGASPSGASTRRPSGRASTRSR